MSLGRSLYLSVLNPSSFSLSCLKFPFILISLTLSLLLMWEEDPGVSSP